ncbi:putative inorganic phosphate cotransporter [Ostrinia furnacalis]|uniref:putative inorganic phosphate cotransporter n=1 Tax=Ostrinia furnacalis TaxID=93504 RepID=UPI00103E0EFD|nr:putative inorganic phosphate cotransporter [Ostrinia furnacalis]
MGLEDVEYVSVLRKDHNDDAPPKLDVPKGFGARHRQALILFLCLTVGIAMRAQLSVSMVAMTSPTQPNIVYLCNVTDIDNVRRNRRNNDTFTDYSNEQNDTEAGNRINDKKNNPYWGKCTEKYEIEPSKWSPYRTYKWSKPTQEMILFSFFVGYTTMMLPMGVITQKYGGKRPILVALAVNGVLSILTPWFPLFTGWIGVCICRLVQGFTQAAFYPGIHTILGKWAPLSERGRLATYIYSGSQFGTVFIFQISGVLAAIPWLGWPSIFWMCGSLSLCCFGLLAWFGAASPHDCATISSEELAYIIGDRVADVSSKRRRTPWKHILTSTAVWGMILTQAGSAMAYLLMLNETPTYMSNVLKVNIKKNGLYSSLPYIAMYVMLLFFGWLSDILVVKKILSVRNVRRVANSIGTIGSGTFLIAFGFANSTGLAVVMLILCLGFHSATHVGFHINHIDLAPNYAGTLMALSNMIANLTSLLVPVMVSNIINDMTNHRQWQTVFIIVSVIKFVTNLFYVIFARGEVQDWNFYGDETEQYPLKQGLTVIEEKNTRTSNGKTPREA